MKPATLRALVPPAAAALVTLAGAALLWAGLSRTSAFGGDGTLTGTLPAVTQPVVVTAPGMSDLTGGHVTVTATAPGNGQVFIGIGRSGDVEAYLGGAARAEVVALEPGGQLRVAARAGEPSLPDPAGVDVWAADTNTAGTATLSWDRAPGSWRVVVAAGGRTPPASMRIAWAGGTGSSSAPALIAIGAVLLVAGLAALLAIRSGRMFASPAPATPSGSRRPRPARGTSAAGPARGASPGTPAPGIPGTAGAPAAVGEPAAGVPAAGVPAAGVPAAGVPAGTGADQDGGPAAEPARPVPARPRGQARRHAQTRPPDADPGLDDDGEDAAPVPIQPFRRGRAWEEDL